MAEAAAQPGKQGEERGGYRVRATWQAISHLPLENFPLILPHVHPVAAFFILRRLKHRGFSDCKVVTTAKGLVVHAQR
ncbi:hypothetical protein F6V25_06565 [Oryzomonas japonica]|uniref:Uncharacterized protein n=1 Tax=Oryzomonas japonica TaxID=2603858 RepID=A0A7J4ZSR4_9BACT|nr:hypothetical protein [Oryzomonas japonica]KAB0666131.1 hypothetical protein F6V25_06565 [Oryzomonas japonica]